MSGLNFNHSICDDCWQKQKSDKPPIRTSQRPESVCCFCGAHHQSGIFTWRMNLQGLICEGNHDRDGSAAA
jgi:hypothetical protein